MSRVMTSGSSEGRLHPPQPGRRDPAVVGRRCSDADVAAVDVEPIGTGQTGATYRLAVGYADAVDLPATFAIKLSSQDDTVRERVALGYRSEHAFYTGVADLVRVPIPKHYHCEISEDGGDFVLLLADMAPAVQGDQIGGCTPDEADLAVRALAGLHGPTWCDPEWIELPGPGDVDGDRRRHQGARRHRRDGRPDHARPAWRRG